MSGAHLNTSHGRDGGRIARPARRELCGWVVPNEQRATTMGVQSAPSLRVAAESRARFVATLAHRARYGLRVAPRDHRLSAGNAAHGGY